jgi:hypothetical protein
MKRTMIKRYWESNEYLNICTSELSSTSTYHWSREWKKNDFPHLEVKIKRTKIKRHRESDEYLNILTSRSNIGPSRGH